MASFFIKNYCLFILRGSLALIFGLIAFAFWPIMELNLFSTILGPFLFCEGAVSIIFLIKNRDGIPLMVAFDGVMCLAIGMFIIYSWQDMTNAMLIIFIAIWAIGTGLIRAIAAASMHKQKHGTWLLDVSALTSIIFGLMIVFRPYGNNISMIWIISTYAVFFGILMIILGIVFRGKNRMVTGQDLS